jgi:hypothetical protein
MIGSRHGLHRNLVAMSRGKQFVLMNVSAVIGIAISLFILPANTRFWMWASIAAIWLVGINCYLIFKRPTAKHEHKSPRETKVIIWFGLTVLVVDVVLNQYFR